MGKTLAALPDWEMEALQVGLHLRRPEPHPLLCVGERVRIRSGALSGLQGIVIRTKNDMRLVLTLDVTRQSVSVEVSGNEIEAIGERQDRAGR